MIYKDELHTTPIHVPNQLYLKSYFMQIESFVDEKVSMLKYSNNKHITTTTTTTKISKLPPSSQANFNIIIQKHSKCLYAPMVN